MRLVELNNRISIAQFVRGHLRDKNQMESLIPANVGIASPAIEAAIAKYNELLLKRDQLQANSSSQNPLVQELNTQLAAQRLSIITSIDNLLSTLEVERRGILSEQSSYKGRITSVDVYKRQPPHSASTLTSWDEATTLAWGASTVSRSWCSYCWSC